MEYTFMNKNVELFDIEMERGHIESISRVRENNLHLVPVFMTPKRNKGISKADFQEWWRGRRIPASRQGISSLKFELGNITLDELAEKSWGLSLSDHYWVRPSENIKWEDVNFFDNDFSDDIGNLLVTGDWEGGSFMSPDNTSDGVVKKRWKIINGERILLKGSSDIFTETQPFREVFASKIAEALFKPYSTDMVVPYWIIKESYKKGDTAFSACPNFVTKDTEYVAFNQINSAYKRDNSTSPINHCRSFYPGDAFILDLILIADYIFMNEDRHFGNFGLIRNTNTGEFISSAPIFDSGSSLFYDSKVIRKNAVDCKPFRKKFDEQIKLVDVKKYYDGIKLVKDNYENIFWESFRGSPEDKDRLELILKLVGVQIEELLDMCDKKSMSSNTFNK